MGDNIVHLIAKVGISRTSVLIKESFCVYAMETPDAVMVVPDATLDHRFSLQYLNCSQCGSELHGDWIDKDILQGLASCMICRGSKIVGRFKKGFT